MKRIALFLVLAMAAVGCKASVKVQAKTAEAPKEEPKPEPPPPPKEEPHEGEQITLPDQIEFEFDQARIKQTPKTLETLQKLAEIMKNNPNITKLRIEGHTDNVGTKRHNDRLSKARAEAVAKWLGQHEIEEKRIVTVGYGASRPLKSNDTAENRAQNRRTEYYVEEVDGKKAPENTKTVAAAPSTSGGT